MAASEGLAEEVGGVKPDVNIWHAQGLRHLPSGMRVVINTWMPVIRQRLCNRLGSRVRQFRSKLLALHGFIPWG